MNYDTGIIPEKTIEKKVCQYAVAIGYFQCKLQSPQQRSVPDRLFINPDGLTIYIEFKRGGLVATPAQSRKHQQMHALVFVVDNIAEGRRILDLYVDYKI
jgi:hypothetical protein